VTEAERRSALDAIAQEVAVCTRCRLHQTRTKAVPGEGHPATEVVFVGEGPGFNEDRQGKPFVGQAGAKLDALLASIQWRRDEVFITNVVKCRPPENRDPEPDEIAACAPFLTRQLEALDPALVVTLGRFSMSRFNPGSRIGQVHGTYRPADAESGAPEALAYAMYHPAAALHQGSLNEALFRDMLGVPAALIAARERRVALAAAVLPVEPATEPATGPAPPDEIAEDVLAPVEPARPTTATAPQDEAGAEEAPAPLLEAEAQPPAEVAGAIPAPVPNQEEASDVETASPTAPETETRPAAQLPLF
jgi:DNA polymerase